MKASADSPQEGFQFFLVLVGLEDLIIVFVGNK